MVVLEADAVLFDSDGVLIDSHQVVEKAWRQLAAEFDLDTDGLLREHAGVRAEDTLRKFLPPKLTGRAVARLEELEMDLADQAAALPGALALTRQLPAQQWAIVTSAGRRLAIARWAAAGLVAPPTTVTADDVSAGKPDPAPYLTAAGVLGVDPTRCVVLEDSPSGGAAASASGATVVAVGDQPWAIEPAVRVDDLTQITYADGAGRGRPGALTIARP